jgi:hypothetical protein
VHEIVVAARGTAAHVIGRLVAPEGVRITPIELPEDRAVGDGLLLSFVDQRGVSAVLVLDAEGAPIDDRLEVVRGGGELLPMDELLEELVWLGLDAEPRDDVRGLLGGLIEQGVPEAVELGLSSARPSLAVRAAQLALDVVGERLPAVPAGRRARRRRPPVGAAARCRRVHAHR